MATLTVGQSSDFQFQTIADAIAASSRGDTIQVQAGNYVDDYPPSITHDLTIVGVGGQVQMIATADNPPPNEKAIMDIGAPGVNVTVQNVTFSNAVLSDGLGGNGAGIRYEGGNLNVVHDGFFNNQDGLLAASDPSGSITAVDSVFSQNGSGTGQTHNIYVNDVGTLTLDHSEFLGAVVGHEIKSRAENTIITNNLIADGGSGTASYSIDLPNGGNATIANNQIEKGPNAQNPVIITTGEEGNVYASSSLIVNDNTIVNDETAHSVTAVRNETSATAQITDNSVWGLTPDQIASGPADVSGTGFLTTEPSWGGDAAATVSPATLSAATDTAQLGFIAGQGSAGQGSSTGQVSTGQDSTGQDSTGQDSTGQDSGSQASAGQPGNAASGGNLIDVAVGATVDAGSGAPDLFRFTAGVGGSDLILNFRPGVDHLQLAGFGPGEEQAAVAGAQDGPAGTVLTLTDGAQVSLSGVHAVSASLFG